MSSSREPLFRYPVLRTSSVEEFEHELVDIYGASGFDLDDPAGLNARGNFVRLGDTCLGFGATGSPVRIHFPESDFARLQFLLRGHGATRCGNRTVEVDVDRPSLTSAGRPTMLQYGAEFEHLFLRVKSDALERKLSALLGLPLRQQIDFELSAFSSPARLSGLRRLVDLVVAQLDDGNSLLVPAAVRELEQAAIVQLLFAGRHNYSELLEQTPRDTAPVHVRRVEAYIEANWSGPIMIEALARISGVSARTLFRTFEKARGCSPMTFVKKIRLQHARRLLSTPDEATTVSETAFACGFSNLGHFASAYRNAFGELPSQTLSRSRSSF
jgi:AraC-like DNA-binding protein